MRIPLPFSYQLALSMAGPSPSSLLSFVSSDPASQLPSDLLAVLPPGGSVPSTPPMTLGSLSFAYLVADSPCLDLVSSSPLRSHVASISTSAPAPSEAPSSAVAQVLSKNPVTSVALVSPLGSSPSAVPAAPVVAGPATATPSPLGYKVPIFY